MRKIIIYIRHGEDIEGNYKHDGRLTSKGKKDSRILAENLIREYGIPDIIYCSPFYRTRQTRRQFLKVINNKVINITDVRLSRFFSEKEKENPEVRDDTMKKNIPIYETWKEFKSRVKSQLKDMENQKDYKVIWCIGHTLIIKQIAKIKKISISDHIECLDTIILIS